jgi:hypothetical protein
VSLTSSSVDRERMRGHVNNLTRHSYARTFSGHFLATCSDGISVSTNLAACLLILFTSQSEFMFLLSGFALVYLLDLTNAMSWMIMQATTVEAGRVLFEFDPCDYSARVHALSLVFFSHQSNLSGVFLMYVCVCVCVFCFFRYESSGTHH